MESQYRQLPADALAPLLKVLAEPNRLRILCSMGLECRPVSDIVNATGLTQTNVSFHLRALREAGLVKGERSGPYVYYCLYDTGLLEILCALETWRQAHSRDGDGAVQAVDCGQACVNTGTDKG